MFQSACWRNTYAFRMHQLFRDVHINATHPRRTVPFSKVYVLYACKVYELVSMSNAMIDAIGIDTMQ